MSERHYSWGKTERGTKFNFYLSLEGDMSEVSTIMHSLTAGHIETQLFTEETGYSATVSVTVKRKKDMLAWLERFDFAFVQ
jgi:hypothetical protein